MTKAMRMFLAEVKRALDVPYAGSDSDRILGERARHARRALDRALDAPSAADLGRNVRVLRDTLAETDTEVADVHAEIERRDARRATRKASIPTSEVARAADELDRAGISVGAGPRSSAWAHLQAALGVGLVQAIDLTDRVWESHTAQRP